METLSTLANVQLERTRALSAKLKDNPVRTATLDGIQRRNAVLDAVFYDVDVVTPAETKELAFWLAREGAIVFVPPTGKGNARVYLTPEEYFGDAPSVAALAIAGVGSSALGAAAFARNVADALDEPVAAVVSGYGLADVLTEALGGFFWFGALNSIRHLFEPLDNFTKMFSRSEQIANGYLWARTSRDTETIISLLGDSRFSPRVLVGHSKGNLVLSEALYAIADGQPELAQQLAARSRIFTISAKVGMPSVFKDVIDIMGGWDWFGALNSRPDIPADVVVPNAWHSTNPEFPFGMGIDVVKVVKAALSMSPNRDFVGARVHTPPYLSDVPQRMTAALRGGGIAIPAT